MTATGAAGLAMPAVLRAQTMRSVVIIGAGAAGMTAAYHLKKAGVQVRVLEAAPIVGGRVARLTGLTDFPIDLGAEWIHEDPEVLGRILGRGETDMGVETIVYRPQTYQLWHDGRLRNRDFLRHTYAEAKFHSTTWFGFFERFMLPEIADDLVLNAPVSEVSYDASGVRVRVRDGRVYDADQVLVCVPLSILKRAAIRFSPGLPNRVTEGLDEIEFGNGFKVFMTFSERFFPDMLITGSVSDYLAEEWDSKLYFDGGFGKNSRDNLLTLFTVAAGDLPRARLGDAALLQAALDELTEIYGDVVRPSFQDGFVQNWSQKPFIQGSYSMDWEEDPVDVLAPVDGRVFFAGEVLGGDAQSTVHGAAFSSVAAIEAMAQA